MDLIYSGNWSSQFNTDKSYLKNMKPYWMTLAILTVLAKGDFHATLSYSCRDGEGKAGIGMEGGEVPATSSTVTVFPASLQLHCLPFTWWELFTEGSINGWWFYLTVKCKTERETDVQMMKGFLDCSSLSPVPSCQKQATIQNKMSKKVNCCQLGKKSINRQLLPNINIIKTQNLHIFGMLRVRKQKGKSKKWRFLQHYWFSYTAWYKCKKHKHSILNKHIRKHQ